MTVTSTGLVLGSLYGIYSGTSLIRTPLGQKKVSRLVRCPDFRGFKNCTQTWYLEVQKGVLFIEVSSFQGVLIRGFYCPHFRGST